MAASEEAKQNVAAPEQDLPMPDILEAPYQGPSAFGMATLRGAFFGAIGWITGRAFGDLGAKPKLRADGSPNPKYFEMKSVNFSIIAGLFGGILGVYAANKDAISLKKQVDELQQIGKKQHHMITDLRRELRFHLRGYDVRDQEISRERTQEKESATKNNTRQETPPQSPSTLTEAQGRIHADVAVKKEKIRQT